MFRLMFNFLKFLIIVIVILLVGQVKLGKKTIAETLEINIKKIVNNRTNIYEPLKAKLVDLENFIKFLIRTEKEVPKTKP